MNADATDDLPFVSSPNGLVERLLRHQRELTPARYAELGITWHKAQAEPGADGVYTFCVQSISRLARRDVCIVVNAFTRNQHMGLRYNV